MVRRVNRGSGNALGIIAAALTATFWVPIAIILFLIWLPLWVWILAACGCVVGLVIYEVNRELPKWEGEGSSFVKEEKE